jgi:hypothetical protein
MPRDQANRGPARKFMWWREGKKAPKGAYSASKWENGSGEVGDGGRSALMTRGMRPDESRG